MPEWPDYPWRMFETGKGMSGAPKSKAERLLRRTLSRKEYFRYMARGYVLVKGSNGGLYKLTKSRAYNVHQLRPEKRTMCAVPADVAQLDYADIIVAQYLALINDEKKFVKTANIQGSGSEGMFDVCEGTATVNDSLMYRTEAMGGRQREYEYNMRRRAHEEEEARRRGRGRREPSRMVIFQNLLRHHFGERDTAYVLHHIEEHERINQGEFIADLDISHNHGDMTYTIKMTSNRGNEHFIATEDRQMVRYGPGRVLGRGFV